MNSDKPHFLSQPVVKNIFMYRNGDPYYEGRRLVINEKRVNNFETFLKEVTGGIQAPYGAVRTIYTPKAGHRVSSLEHLQSGEQYVAAGKEKFKKLDYLHIGTKKKKMLQNNGQESQDQATDEYARALGDAQTRLAQKEAELRKAAENHASEAEQLRCQVEQESRDTHQVEANALREQLAQLEKSVEQEMALNMELQQRQTEQELLAQRDDVSSQLQEVNHANSRLLEQVTELGQEKDKLQQELEETRKAADKRQAMLDELAIGVAQEKSRHKEELSDVRLQHEKELAQLEKSVEQEMALNMELQQRQTEQEKLLAQRDDVSSQLQEVNHANSRLLEQVTELGQEKDKLQQELEETRKTADKRQAMLDELAIDVAQEKSRHKEELSGVRLQHEKEVLGVRARYEKELRGLHEDKNRTEEEIRSQLRNEKARTRELESLQQTVKKLQAQIQSMEGTKGWFEQTQGSGEDEAEKSALEHQEQVKPVPQSRIIVSARFLKPIKEPCTIFIIANGDVLNPAVRLLIPQRVVIQYERVLETITEKMGLRILGGVRSLYTLDGTVITEGKDLENGQFYVAVGRDKFKKLPYNDLIFTKPVGMRRFIGSKAASLPPIYRFRKQNGNQVGRDQSKSMVSCSETGDPKISPPGQQNKDQLASIVSELSQARLMKLRQKKSGLTMTLGGQSNDDGEQGTGENGENPEAQADEGSKDDQSAQEQICKEAGEMSKEPAAAGASAEDAPDVAVKGAEEPTEGRDSEPPAPPTANGKEENGEDKNENPTPAPDRKEENEEKINNSSPDPDGKEKREEKNDSPTLAPDIKEENEEEVPTSR
ncbi:hypothetical protein AAFF_G00116540 [Aldrovandia affinis]|uniref:Doublecortin domain-containing protein 2 n=1 Tax=Aldrovandia affinis TaxID=143900 RepID=A0AAD7T1K9_9TELE|nr:hypothetical protein AAFF_G00116540 [Aldrovandia affinis]